MVFRSELIGFAGDTTQIWGKRVWKNRGKPGKTATMNKQKHLATKRFKSKEHPYIYIIDKYTYTQSINVYIYIYIYCEKTASWHQAQENMNERCNLSQHNALFAEGKTHIPWAQIGATNLEAELPILVLWPHFWIQNLAPVLGPQNTNRLFNTGSKCATAAASWQQHIPVILNMQYRFIYINIYILYTT